MQSYKEIKGWFPDESAKILQELIEGLGVTRVLEVGAYLGRSTGFFAERVDAVTVIDPFTTEGWADAEINGDVKAWAGEGSFYNKFHANMCDLGVIDKINIVEATSAQASRLKKTQLSFSHPELVYIDGAHDYENVKQDLLLWKDYAMKVICGDDYDDNWPGVKKAVDEVFPERVIEGRFWYVIYE